MRNYILFFLFITLLISCSDNGKHYKIGVSQCSEDIWRDWQNAELRMEANFHEGVELFFSSADDNSERQIQQIDSLVNLGIDLLIVAPNQLANVSPAIDRVYDKGIPVIVFERKTDSHKYTAFVSADNDEMGKLMGEYIVNRLNRQGKIMEIMGLKGSSPADERHQGFREALEDNPNVSVVATLQGDWTEETAYKVVKEYQGDLSEIDFVFGHNDRTAMGARKAFLEVMDEKDLPLFCGIDGLPGENGGIRQVRDSLLDASYIYPTRGDQLLQLALDILDGKPYQKETNLTSALVTRENANVLLLESDEVMRQAGNLEKLHQKADGYLKQLANQQMLTLLAIGCAVLFLILLIIIYLYQRQKAKINAERGKMEREQLDFYSQVSHELRTPLTLIEGPLTQLAGTKEMQNAGKETTELLDIVRRNTGKLTDLINKMLDVQVGKEQPKDIIDDEQNDTHVNERIDQDVNVQTEADIDLPTVLIVDDNDDIRTYLRTILHNKYQLFEAADGQQGLNCAREQVPDLIISDVMMPVMNGLEFCQHIKKDIITSHIPVILLTARALNKHQIEGYESGADAYITKPFSPDVLMARINNLMRNRHLLKDIWMQTTQCHDNTSSATSENVETQNVENEFICRFKAVVEEKMMDSDLSVEMIGQELNLSRVQLYRKVKALTGCSPVDLVKKARMTEAMKLLTETQLSISEIAYKTGFTSPSYFSKCFKEEFGKVPGDIRK